MNQPTEPPNLPTTAPQPALPADAGLGAILDTLLKRPVVLIRALCDPRPSRHWLILALVALPAFALYGLLVGTFSGGSQLPAALVKVSAGGLVSALICFPSLYIFACLSGAEVSLRGTAGVLSAMLTLTGLLLLGFAPVAWVFSQSTDSVVFIGTLHLIFWFIATWFGLRLFGNMTKALGVSDRTHLKVWMGIFVLVCLQMTTALRPIIGTSPHWLPTEKKFFVAHWIENFAGAALPASAN
ncbi:MAG: hypothetical protein K8R23_16575 [Chthoniobacter sp.]|nr:hypothetical protein [Chthoniobacter sp.]